MSIEKTHKINVFPNKRAEINTPFSNRSAEMIQNAHYNQEVPLVKREVPLKNRENGINIKDVIVVDTRIDGIRQEYSKYNDAHKLVSKTNKQMSRQLHVVFKSKEDMDVYDIAHERYPYAMSAIVKKYFAELIINDIPLGVALNISLKNLANAPNIAENEQQPNKPSKDD